MRALRLFSICTTVILGGALTVYGSSHQTSLDPALRDAVEALQQVYATDIVLGAPLEIGAVKIIPLATVAIGYGQKQGAKEKGPSLGTAGLVSPVGVLVVSARGVQLLPVSKGLIEQLLSAVTPVILQVIGEKSIENEGTERDSRSELLWPTVLARLYRLLPENGLKFGVFPWPLGLVILFIVGWLALALLVGVFLPQQVSAVATTLQDNLLRTGLIGILSYGVGFLLAIVFGVSIIGFPFAIMVLVLMWTLTLLGMISIASIVGHRSAMAMRRADASPITSILVGGVILGVVRVIPVLGWVVWLVIGIFGMGAVVRAVRQEGQEATGS